MIDSSWLIEKVTVSEAERNHTSGPGGVLPGIPFRYLNEVWKDLISNMQPGDELWKFRSPEETWYQLCGREGYVIIRDGKQIANIVTTMN